MNEEPVQEVACEQAVSEVPVGEDVPWEESFKILSEGRGFIGEKGCNSYSYSLSTCMWDDWIEEGSLEINYQGDTIYLNSENASLIKEVIDIFLEKLEEVKKEKENDK